MSPGNMGAHAILHRVCGILLTRVQRPRSSRLRESEDGVSVALACTEISNISFSIMWEWTMNTRLPHHSSQDTVVSQN